MKSQKRGVHHASKTEEIFYDNGETLLAHFNFDSNDIKEGKKLGEGIWTVHEAEWLGRKFVVKKFGAESTFDNIFLTSREVNRMLALRHPNVLKLLGFYLTKQQERVLDCTMIMELMDCDLEKYLEGEALSDDQVVYIIAEVARGMKHIHKSGCFHRDLKPKNILLKKSIVSGFHVDVKIADFGSSELMGVGNIDPKAGTLGYKAPEQFGSPTKAPEQFRSPTKFFQEKVDVFGFGALCFKILTGKEPYESHVNVREAIMQIDRATISQRNLLEDVVEMIWECLDVDPESRPNFEKISFILDGALSTIREKMPRPLPLSASASLDSKESILKRVPSHLDSILHNMGLSRKHAIHFIPFEELFVGSKIGAGAFSNVYKVQWKGVLYALKVFAVDRMGDFDTDGTYFQTFPKLLHKNIVTFMGYSITPDGEISIVMELLEMDLAEALYTHRRHGQVLDIQKKWVIVKEIANGMKYLHDQGIMHGDLRPDNVLVSAMNTNRMIVKLVDFANNIQSFTRREILSGAPPFDGMSGRQIHEAIVSGRRQTLPIGTSSEMESLIKSCWSGDPLERPDFPEVCRRLSSSLHYQSCQGQHTQEPFVQSCFPQSCCIL